MIYFLLVFQQLLASTTHIVGQQAGQHMVPVLVLVFRASIASVALLILMRLTRSRSDVPIQREDVSKLIWLGVLNVPINQWLFLEGLQFTTPANSALLYSMTPAFVFLLTLVVHRESPSVWKIVGIVIAFVGVSIIIFEHGASFASDQTLGNAMIFLAVIAWSLYTLVGKPLVQKYGALRVTAINMAIGAVAFLPVGLLRGDLSTIQTTTGGTWMEILYLALVASVLNYFLWFYALGKLETSKVAIFQNLQPVMTTVLALILGRAVLTLSLVSGGVLTLIGVILVQLA